MVNRELPVIIPERTVEDSLSEGDELFQAEMSLVSHRPLIQRLTYATMEWSWRVINENAK